MPIIDCLPSGMSKSELQQLSTVDKYNVPILTKEVIREGGTNNLLNGSYTSYSGETGFNYASQTGILLGGSYNTSTIRNAFDNSTSTSWYTENKTYDSSYIYWKMDKPTKITKLKTYITIGTYSGECFKIYGSYDNKSWTVLYTGNSSQTSLTEITLLSSSTGYYSYYKIQHGGGAGKSIMYVYECQISEYSDELAYTYNLSIDIDNYELNKIINIHGVNFEFDNTVTKDVYLNVNNLGLKIINGIVNFNQKYQLVYNGESWDVLNQKRTLSWTLGELATEFNITNINKYISDYEEFEIYIQDGAAAGADVTLYINDVEVRKGTMSDNPVYLKFIRFRNKLICFSFYSNDTFDNYRVISFDGTINSIKQAVVNTSYKLLATNTVNLIIKE